MEENKIKDRLNEMKQKLDVLEWDAERDQINPAKRVKYEELKEKYDKLAQDLKESEE